ncbi:MAG: alpha/beta fold hydrolase [Cyanobacteria bacterium J06648_16]
MDKQNIEAIYPLAPLQQAFLWHSLQTSAQAGLLHVRCTLQGLVNVQQLRQAWEWVVGQHPALRTSVHWEGVKQPLQVVARQVTLPWAEVDGRDHPQRVLEDFLSADCDRTLTLTQAPIMRLALIRLTDSQYELVWTCHHLMLDGWSGALVLNQVFDTYAQLQQGQALEVKRVTPYQAYIQWLKQQDKDAAEAFWQQTLAGGTEAGRLLDGSLRQDTKKPQAKASLTLDSALGEQVTALLRSHRITFSTLMQGVWSLLLHQLTGQTDILFGTTVSGRQADLPGVESIVGLLISVLPVRVQVALEQNGLSWLQTLQAQQATASQYAYASLAQIQDWCSISGQLFDSLLVIENYPIREANANGSLQVNNIQSGVVSTYGLTLIVKPGAAITLQIEGNGFDSATLKSVLQQFQSLLISLVEAPTQPLGSGLPTLDITLAATAPDNPAYARDLSRATLEETFVAPANPLELKLAQIWETVLEVRPLSVEASFFDLGGNSLLAVQLFNQMQQQLDCALPLATLFQAPNVRQFAALLSQRQTSLQWTSLVPIQTSGSQPPLFFHGGSADALTWARFAHLLGPEQPFYALQRPDLDGSDVVHHTVEALATDCIKEMRMVQPAGPYLVGGHCFGGAVAVEIAQQLQAAGEEIAEIVLIDAYRPASLANQPLVQRQLQLQQAYFWLRKNYYYHGGWERLAQLPTKIWRRIRPAAVTVQSAAAQSESVSSDTVPDPTGAIPYEYRYARAQAANETAADRYDPQLYAGRMTLFRARVQTLDWYFGPSLGWQVVAKDPIEIINIPGFFGNLFNQRSGPLLAERVRQHLAQQHLAQQHLARQASP